MLESHKGTYWEDHKSTAARRLYTYSSETLYLTYTCHEEGFPALPHPTILVRLAKGRIMGRLRVKETAGCKAMARR